MKKMMLLVIILVIVGNIIPVTGETVNNLNSPSGLPKFFSWRDINGTDFTTSVKTQGLCPSCEAYGLVAALETIIQYKLLDILSMLFAASLNAISASAEQGIIS